VRTRERVGAANREVYREAILTAAADVFGRLGYAQAKIADIAEAAGVAAGTVYNYFENKEAVFAAIVERGRLDMVQRLDVASTDRRGRARLSAVLLALFEALDEQASMFRVWLEVSGLPGACSDRTEDGGRADVMKRFESAIAEAIGLGELRVDVPADELTTYLAGSLNAAILRWGAQPEPRGPLRAQVERAFEVFLHGAVHR